MRGLPGLTRRVAIAPAHRSPSRPSRILIVGGGFGGFFAARRLVQLLRRNRTGITIVSDTDGFLYQPLLPDVAVGAIDPRAASVPLNTTLRGVHVVLGRATSVDLDAQTVAVKTSAGRRDLAYDVLLLAPSSVTRMVDVAGLDRYAVGFKSVAEALYLRELVLARMELANSEPDPARRRRRSTFLVIGGGYAGTELVSCAGIPPDKWVGWWDAEDWTSLAAVDVDR